MTDPGEIVLSPPLPRLQHRDAPHVRRSIPPNRDQQAVAQPAEVVLHGALGHSRQLRKVLECDGRNAWRTPAFTAPKQEAVIGGFMNITLMADDVEKTAAALAACGVEFVKPATKEPWRTSAIFKDPDGNRFVLSTP